MSWENDDVPQTGTVEMSKPCGSYHQLVPGRTMLALGLTWDFLWPECKQAWRVSHEERPLFHTVASDGIWRAESCSQGALSRYSFSWRHSPVRGSAWTFRFLRLEYLRNLRRRRQFLTLGLPWLNAFRRVELDLASRSPWGHFSASDWTGFKRLAFTSFRTLVCLRICLRTIGRVCLENT